MNGEPGTLVSFPVASILKALSPLPELYRYEPFGVNTMAPEETTGSVPNGAPASSLSSPVS